MIKDTRNIDLTARITREDDGGYRLYCPELDISAIGEDAVVVIENFKEALLIHMEETAQGRLH